MHVTWPRRAIFAAMLLAAGIASYCVAQPPSDGPPKDKPPARSQSGRPEGAPPRRPPSPLEQALDSNHDEEISAEEMKNATAALETLDANHDGKLTRDEFKPKRPAGDRGGPDGPPPPPRGSENRPAPPEQKS